MNEQQLEEFTDLVIAVSIAHEHLSGLSRVCNEYDDSLMAVLSKEEFDELMSFAEKMGNLIEDRARQLIKTNFIDHV